MNQTTRPAPWFFVSVCTKVTKEETLGVNHHLLGFLDPVDGFRYNVHQYRRDCWRLIDDMRGRGVTPVVVGGTNYYIEAVLWDDFLRNKGGQATADEISTGLDDDIGESALPRRSWPDELL